MPVLIGDDGRAVAMGLEVVKYRADEFPHRLQRGLSEIRPPALIGQKLIVHGS